MAKKFHTLEVMTLTTAINLDDLRRLTLADVAAESGVSYGRLWRAARGGLMRGLTRDEETAINRVLEQRRTHRAVTNVA